MPRPTTTRATRRSRAQTSRQAPSLRPAQPVVSEAGNDAAQIGSAIGEALGIGGKLAGELDVQRAQEDFRKGLEDYNAGIVDDELAARSEEYVRARTQLKARADWAHDKAKLEEALRQNGFEEMSEDEVNGYIDEFYRQEYEGYDDPDAVEWLAPRMAEQRLAILERKAEMTRDQLKAADATRLQVAFRAALAEDPAEAYELLGEMSGRLFDNEERTAMYASILFDAAIDQGRPELVDDMPGTYPGTDVPTIKNNPAWQERIRNARRAAVAERQRLDNQAETEAAEEHAAWEDQAEADIVEDLLRGTPGAGAYQVRVADLLADGFDPARARTLIRFGKAMDSQTDPGAAPDWDRVADVQTAIVNGEYTDEQFNADIRAGVFGGGKQRATLVGRYAGQMRAVESAIRNDPMYRAVQQQLVAEYSGPRAFEEQLPQLGQRRAEALRRWVELQFTGDGMDPEAAAKAVRDEITPLSVEQLENALNGGSKSAPETAIARWRNGAVGADSVLEARPDGLEGSNREYLMGLLEDGLINADEYEKLKNEVR